MVNWNEFMSGAKKTFNKAAVKVGEVADCATESIKLEGLKIKLAEKYDIDGVWIDGDCWRARADFHPETLANFEKETGIDLGGKLPATPADPYYDEYREYNRELFRRYVRHYVDVLHEKFPDLQIASNWAFSDHMPEKVTANVDFLSGDLNPSNSFNSARYAARALAQQNYPWDLMSWNFRREIGQYSAVIAKHPKQIMQEAAAVISLGGAYQNYVMQYFDGSPNMTDIRNLTSLAEFVKERDSDRYRSADISHPHADERKHTSDSYGRQYQISNLHDGKINSLLSHIDANTHILSLKRVNECGEVFI